MVPDYEIHIDPLTAETLISKAAIVVHIIDDDEPTRRALTRLMLSAGMQGIPHPNVAEFMESGFEKSGDCVIADVHTPENNSLLLPERLQEISVAMPVIFITGDYSVETRERIRKAGGQAYLGKPVDDQALLDTIRWTVHSQ